MARCDRAQDAARRQKLQGVPHVGNITTAAERWVHDGSREGRIRPDLQKVCWLEDLKSQRAQLVAVLRHQLVAGDVFTPHNFGRCHGQCTVAGAGLQNLHARLQIEQLDQLAHLGWLGGEELVVLVGQDRSGVQNLLDQVGNRFIEDMRLQTGVPASTQ